MLRQREVTNVKRTYALPADDTRVLRHRVEVMVSVQNKDVRVELSKGYYTERDQQTLYRITRVNKGKIHHHSTFDLAEAKRYFNHQLNTYRLTGPRL